MQQWFGFYAVVGAAAATLLGLLFVAISINAAAALGSADGTTKRLAEQAFQDYLAVMMVALLALFPDMRTSTFGFVTLTVTGVWAIWVVIRLYQTITQTSGGRARLQAARRHIGSVVGFAILTVTAVRMATNQGADFDWLASASIVLLFEATTVSWELLVRIAHPAAPAKDR